MEALQLWKENEIMSAHGGPDVSTDGLVLALDAANIKSFRGPAQTNLLTGINYSISNTDQANFKVTNGTEVTNVPTRGIRTVKYVDIYNNQPDISCCPNLYNFGDITVTGNTQYTYSILYKTNTGYSHPNYMYRYEYNGGTYVTEAGVHSTSNRTDLGDGWYHAWGTFTTQASTNRLITYLFHYEYGTFNRVYVDSIQITQGSYIGVPQHMLEPAQVRGTTVATGGGWADRSGNSNHGELVNGPTFDNDNLGSIVFDGVDDEIFIDNSSSINFIGTQQYTALIWVYPNLGGTTWHGVVSKGNAQQYALTINSPNAFLHYETNQGGIGALNSANNSVDLNKWQQVGIRFDGSTKTIWKNGISIASQSASALNSSTNTEQLRIGEGNNGEQFRGNIAQVSIYNRALTTSEIQQNYNALKSRYGL